MITHLLSGELAQLVFASIRVDQVFPFTSNPAEGGLFLCGGTGLYVIYDNRKETEKPRLAFIARTANDSVLAPVIFASSIGARTPTEAWAACVDGTSSVVSTLISHDAVMTGEQSP